MNSSSNLNDINEFWSKEPCGSYEINSCKNKRDFFKKYRKFRYSLLWHIPALVPFQEVKGKNVLEIGCGNGADGVMFAINGADYTGVDLTQTAVDAAREHFELLGLKGTFQIENAEQLSFDDNTFDMIYSYGVLHHTYSPAKAVMEVYRVLKPDGKAVIMLYHKNSFNYYIRIMGYMRFRVLFKILSRLGQWKSDREKYAGEPMTGLRGNRNKQIWDIHYRNFLKEGWQYLMAGNFVHHCTDGPECPRAYVFTKETAREAFSMFREIEMKAAHFPLRRSRWGRWIPLEVEKFLSKIWGWYLYIYATK